MKLYKDILYSFPGKFFSQSIMFRRRGVPIFLSRKFFILFFIQLLVLSAHAVHIKGGWINYEYQGQAANGDNIYKIIVRVYRDCAVPNPGQNDPTINVTVFRNDDFTTAANIDAPQSDMYKLQKQTFSECINPKPVVCYVILEYTGTVQLPSNAAGYTASFQRCCRINGIVNVEQPSNEYGNTYTIKIPGTANGVDNPKNSSPLFVQKDTVAVCYNSPIELDYGASDPDGDSLVFSFTGALVGASQADPSPGAARKPPYSILPYLSPYTPANPFGTNISINPKTGLIKGLSPAIIGEYVLAVSVKEFRKGVYIAETRKELHVNVAPCTIASADLPIRITTCDGFTLQFENLSVSPSIHSYYWDFGVQSIASDTSYEPRPIYTYADSGIYTAKLVVNKGQACTDSATSEVHVFPGFFPDFSFTGSCFSNPVVFNNTSTTRYGQINFQSWNFGDLATLDDTSSIRTPQYKYPAPGIYNVTISVSSDKGCSGSITQPVEVANKPLLQLPFRDTLICSIDSLVLRAIGTGSFSWTPTTRMINSNTATPTVFPLDTTVYTVMLNDRGCVATDSVKVNTLDFITVDAGPDTLLCRGDATTLHPVSQALSYHWAPAAGLNNADIKNPAAKPLEPVNVYTVTANLGKCQATDNLTIRTVPYPEVNAGEDTALCFNDTLVLRGSTNATVYQWTPANLVRDPDKLVTPAYPKGTTTFVLTATGNAGCPKSASDAVLVTMRPKVQAFAGNDTTAVIEEPLQLHGSANVNIYDWTPTAGMNNPSISNPTIIVRNPPDGSGKVQYIFTASTVEGCSASDTLIVRIFKTSPSIFIPNAFTPNKDGKNEVFKPILAGMKRLDFFRIYNRYGELVYETNVPGQGWDGNYKGDKQAGNAFVYECQAVDYMNIVKKLKGTVILIR